MQPNKLPNSLQSFLRVGLLVFMAGCASADLRLNACVIDSSRLGCDCYDAKTKTSAFVNLSQCDKYVSFSRMDLNTLLNYCGVKDGSAP